MTALASRLQRGMALHRAGDLAGAEHAYREVLAEDAGNADALHLLGLIAYRRGDLQDAGTLIASALARDAGNPVFLANLGNVRKDAGDTAGAMASYRSALAIDPRQAGARNNLGTLLLAHGATDEAIACFRAVVAQVPGHARAWFNLGVASARRGDIGAAADAQRRAVAAEPAFADAWAELGLALGALGRHEAAVAALRERLRLAPGAAGADADLALALHRAGDLAAARAHYERALALAPDAVETRCNLLALLQKTCDWPAIDAHWPIVRAAIEHGHPGVPSGVLIAQPGASAALQLAAARANTAALAALPRVGPHRRVEPGRRARLGYLSADFREHATAYLVTELFELHDRNRHEVVLLSYGPDDGSEARARLARAGDRFVDLRDCDDDEAARRIAELGIDVLVDLNGSTDNGRLGIAARRPAPIAVSWLGFPGTLGTAFHDFLLADRHIVPDGDERFYTERIVRLPDCYQCNDRRRPRPGASTDRAGTGLADDAVVLCCFNQAFKITREAFTCWLEILRDDPRAMLWLLEDNAVASAALREAAQRFGVAPERLVFAPHRPLAEHLARYRLADLALDTFPCTSHTTASDALWMACPLVTLTGSTFAGRVATSLVRTAGLPELAVADIGAYRDTVKALVESPARRAALRQRLEAAPDASALFDTPRFVRHFQDALADIVAQASA